MRALGDSKTPLYFLILTSALNIGLDLLFIVPFHFGVLGAALATDISQVISGVLSFIYLRRKFDVLKMEKDDLAFSKKASIRLLGIGVPMGLQCSITAIGSVIMQWAVNVLGSTAVAAVTAAGKTQGLLTVPMESVGTAMATYAGQNLGASRMDRVRQGVNSAMLIILIYGVASAFVLHFTDVQIMGLFLDTAKEVDIVAMGREYLFWNSVFFVPLGALIVWRYSIQGLGFSSLAMLAGVARWSPARRWRLYWSRFWDTSARSCPIPPHGSRPACSCTLRTAGPAANWTTACWPPAPHSGDHAETVL